MGRADVPALHLPFCFGHYTEQLMLGGNVPHHALQVDVVFVRDPADVAQLRGDFFNAEARLQFNVVHISTPEVESVDGVELQRFEYLPEGSTLGVRAVVLIDTRRRLRLEVVDAPLFFTDAELRAFAVEALAAVQLGD